MRYKYEFDSEISCPACEPKMLEKLKNEIPSVSIKANIESKKVTIKTKEWVKPKYILKKLNEVKATKIRSVSPRESCEIDWSIECSGNEENIRKILVCNAWYKSHAYDPFENRVRIFLHTPQDHETIIKAFSGVSGISIRKLGAHDRIYYFTIQGLTDENEPIIAEALDEKNAYIKNFFIKPKTMQVVIHANIEPSLHDENLKAFLAMLNAHLKKKLCEKNLPLCQLEYSFSEDKRQTSENKAESYFNAAKINLVYCIVLFLIKPFIGLPLTLASQVFGLGLGLATFAVMWQTGKVFFKEAWSDYRNNRDSGMASLITLGTGSAWAYSMLIVLIPNLFLNVALQYQFFPISMTLMIINYGRAIREKIKENSDKMVHSRMKARSAFQPKYAMLLKKERKDIEKSNNPENYQEIYYKNIQKNDIILVPSNSRFPIDGVLLTDTQIDVEEYIFRGDDKTIRKKKDQEVSSGSLNRGEPVLIMATCDYKESKLTKLLGILKNSKNSKPSESPLINKISRNFFPIVRGAAIVGFVWWGVVNAAPHLACLSAVTVFLSACPCAIGLSIIPISIGVSEMVTKGMIVRNAMAMEKLAELVDGMKEKARFVFDKSGTLVTLQVKDVDITSYDSLTRDQILLAGAKLESESKKSTHPIAQAFIERGYKMTSSEVNVVDSIGDTQGVSGQVEINGKQYHLVLGNVEYLLEKRCNISDAFKEKARKLSEKGRTVTYIAIDQQCTGVVGLLDEIRPGAKKMVSGLKKLGMEVYMLTGDEEGPALDVAKKLGIDESHVFPNQRAEDKAKIINNLKIDENGNARKVAMLGDGLNDAHALNAADFSMAAGVLTDIAAENENLDLIMEGLNVDEAIIIARETRKSIKQNLWWTLFYNTISVIAAASLLLTPQLAALSMMLSSILVLINSNRLRFEIAEKIKMHRGEIAQPATWFEKMKHLFSLDNFFVTIAALIKISDGNEANPSVEPCASPKKKPSPSCQQRVIARETFNLSKKTARCLFSNTKGKEEEVKPPSTHGESSHSFGIRCS